MVKPFDYCGMGGGCRISASKNKSKHTGNFVGVAGNLQMSE